MSVYSDKNVLGKKFHKLTVMSATDKSYACVCECGTERILPKAKLGITKSCGCARRESNKDRKLDLLGQVFSQLTVVSQVEGSGSKWNCICSCGGEFVAKSSALRAGNNRSCGCLWVEACRINVEQIAKSRRLAQGFPEDFQISSFNKIERGKTKPLVSKVLKRDSFCCAWCSSERTDKVIDVHHLVPWAVSKELRFETSNLVSLCKDCHLKVHQGKHTGPVSEVMTILLQGFVNYQEENLRGEEENLVNLFLS